MSDVRRLVPILTGRHRYDASLSLHGRAPGTMIEAPILAYLIETAHGRVLYDVGCDYRKIADPALRERYYGPGGFPFGPPEMADEDHLPALLARLGIGPRDIDAVVLGHLHFDHAGGLGDFTGAEIHCHADEWAAAQVTTATAPTSLDDFAGAAPLAPRPRRARAVRRPAAGRQPGPHGRAPVAGGGAGRRRAGDAGGRRRRPAGEPGRARSRPASCGGTPTGKHREDLALASIRRLKALAADEGAELWPNHDLAHWQRLRERGWPHACRADTAPTLGLALLSDLASNPPTMRPLAPVRRGEVRGEGSSPMYNERST